MSATERRKGATYELELCRDLRMAGFNAERTSNGRVQVGRGDLGIRELPAIHIEAKRCERYEMGKWRRQADADAPEGSTAMVVYRRSHERSRADVDWHWLVGVLARLADAEAAEDEADGRRQG